LCVGEPMRFQDLSVATEGQVSAHYWEFGDLSQSTEGHPTHVYIHPGMYPVSLFVTTTQGCTSTAHKNLVVLAEDSCATPGGQVFLPNTFTPNGDGLNDRFHAVTNGAVVTGMEIYDRWGRAVFRAINGNPVWDGRLKNGRPARDGVYTYKLSARLPDGDLRQITGFVLLLH
jgi:gliding motility-associated-like protein